MREVPGCRSWRRDAGDRERERCGDGRCRLSRSPRWIGAPGGPDLAGRRALPDVPAAEPRAFLPRRGARHRERPQLHQLGRVAGDEHFRIDDDPDGARRGDRVVPDPLRVPARQPDAVPAGGAAADRDHPPSRSTCGSAGCSTPTWRTALERFQYAFEDLIVTEYLDPTDPFRVPAALEALRVAALSTYENRRVSTGALLLGTAHDPAAPGLDQPRGGAPVQRPADGDQGVPPALRRRADGLPRRPPGRPDAGRRHRPLGRARCRAPSRWPTPARGLRQPRQGDTRRAATSAWC